MTIGTEKTEGHVSDMAKVFSVPIVKFGCAQARCVYDTLAIFLERVMADNQITFIYCICLDLTQVLGIQDGSQFKMNTAEVITVAIIAALFFGEKFSQPRLMLKSHGYLFSMLSESRLNNRMHEIDISV